MEIIYVICQRRIYETRLVISKVHILLAIHEECEQKKTRE